MASHPTSFFCLFLHTKFNTQEFSRNIWHSDITRLLSDRKDKELLPFHKCYYCIRLHFTTADINLAFAEWKMTKWWQSNRNRREENCPQIWVCTDSKTLKLTHVYIYFYSPRSVSLLWEDSDQEITLNVGLEGGRHNAICARGQLVSTTHLAHVDEGGWLGHWSVVLEELHVQGAALCMSLVQLGVEDKEKEPSLSIFPFSFFHSFFFFKHVLFNFLYGLQQYCINDYDKPE